MNITLSESQTKKLIKKYYEEVEGIEVEVQFSKEEDLQYTSIHPTISKTIVFGGIKATAPEDISTMKMTEIINHFLPADYNLKRSLFITERDYDYYDNCVERVNTLIELEPVAQKTRGRVL